MSNNAQDAKSKALACGEEWRLVFFPPILCLQRFSACTRNNALKACSCCSMYEGVLELDDKGSRNISCHAYCQQHTSGPEQFCSLQLHPSHPCAKRTALDAHSLLAASSCSALMWQETRCWITCMMMYDAIYIYIYILYEIMGSTAGIFWFTVYQVYVWIRGVRTLIL